MRGRCLDRLRLGASSAFVASIERRKLAHRIDMVEVHGVQIQVSVARPKIDSGVAVEQALLAVVDRNDDRDIGPYGPVPGVRSAE